MKTCAKLSKDKGVFLLRYSDNGGQDTSGAHVKHVWGYRADVGIHTFIIDKRGKRWFISEYFTGRRMATDRDGWSIHGTSVKDAFETLKSVYIGYMDSIETGIKVALEQGNQVNS